MKHIKSIWMRVLVIVISVAMMIGCFSGLVLADEPATAEGVNLHESGFIPSKVALGDDFTVPAAKDGVTVTVKSPDGQELGQEQSYKAVNLGNYTVVYSNGDVSYTYTINCYEDAEYFIYVENNGADIPSFIKVNTSFELPEWYLAKYDEEGNLVKLTADDNVATSWELTGASRQEEAGENVTIAALGSHIVSLSAQFVGSNKTYSQEFTVIAQTNFEDTKAPTVRNIANMPSSASVNTEVKLPVAVADDNYDENVLVTVSVVDPDGNKVKEVELNEHNYAINELEDDRAFDNDKVTSFYPTKTGTYVVSYVATDDAGNTSSEHTYKIAVSDRTGPVIVDVEDDKIPSVWGLKSVENEAGEVLSGEALTIEIPIPEVVDNLDEFNLNVAGDKAWTGNVKMTVEIANPNATVARWTSLTPSDIEEGEVINATTPSNSTYNKYFKDEVAGVKIGTNDNDEAVLRLNFGDFFDGETTESKTKAGVTGNWTITFSFRDGANNGGYNNSQKVYTINVSDAAFVDEKAPEIEAPSLPDYLIVGSGDETYVVPQIVVSDDNDTRLTEAYTIVSGENSIAVEGGEELKIVENEGKFFFENEDGEQLELGETISFAYTATDDAGNVAVLKDGENDYTVNVYTAQNGYDANNVTYNFVSSVEAGTTEAQYVGEFKIANVAQREFVGFELTIKDAEGNMLDGVSSYVLYAVEGEQENLYVKNIEFNPADGGEYEINVRVFDAKGNSYVYAKKIAAQKVNNEVVVGPNAAAASWDSVGTTGKSYMLQRKAFTVSGTEADQYVRVYKIHGGSFSLLGYEFSPKAQGGYTITEFYAKQADALGADFVGSLTKNAVYGMTVTDSSTTKFEVNGTIPSYVEKTKTPENENRYEDGAYFITDAIIAYSDVQNFDVTVTYTDPDGDNHTAHKVYEYVGADEEAAAYSFKEEADYVFYGRYALVLDKDGSYEVVATANDATGSSRKTYTIKVGDIEAPQFTLDTAAERKVVGDKFAYRSFTDVQLGATEKASEITVTYRIIEPGSGNNAVASVSGSKKLDKLGNADGVYSITFDGEYTFEKSGDYTVEITLEDAAGNRSVQKYTITVSTQTSNSPASLTMLSTVLIIVGALLILGVVVYLIRFRKRRA